jgi:steroid delta-isomerase-like uncharacterized protein
VSVAANREIVRRLFEAVNAGDLEGVLALIGDEMVVHTAVPGIEPGREGFRGFMTVFFTAFPEQRTEVHALVAEGDLVSALHTHHATNLGPFAGMPPTGKRISVDGLELFRVRDGKIVEMWHHDDLLGLMQQLGAVPAPGAPGA